MNESNKHPKGAATHFPSGHCLQATRLPSFIPIIAAILLSACASSGTVKPDHASDATVASPNPNIAITYQAEEFASCDIPSHRALQSIVRVSALDGGEASGVVIANDRVLTAAHALSNDYRALVRIGGETRTAIVLAIDESRDLALLSVETGMIQPIRLSLTHLHNAESVWTVGFPLALEKTTNHGFFQSNVNGAIYASASTNAGASGGGLLRCENGQFELAGMIRAYGAYRRGGELRRIEDLSISVPAELIFDFALSAGVSL